MDDRLSFWLRLGELLHRADRALAEQDNAEWWSLLASAGLVMAAALYVLLAVLAVGR